LLQTFDVHSLVLFGHAELVLLVIFVFNNIYQLKRS